MKHILLVLLITTMLASGAFAAINITADVGNEAPSVGAIQLCDGTCEDNKTLDPNTAYTVKVDVSDPNGQADVNTDAFKLEFYVSTDTNGDAADWDHVTLSDEEITTGTADGCTQSGTTYCLQVEAGDWTTKYVNGSSTVWVRAYDNSEAEDSNTAVDALTVNKTFGHTEDATSGTYSAGPNTTGNAITTDQTNSYVITTHNGNSDIDLSITATQLTSGGDTISVGNQKWHTSDAYGSSAGFTGGSDDVMTSWGRGTDPTSASQNIYLWLDVPAAQPAGSYTGTLTYGSVSS